MNKIRILKTRFTELFRLWNAYSFKYALNNFIWWLCFYFRLPFSYRLSSYAIYNKTIWLDKYISNKYADIIYRYKNNPPNRGTVYDYKIWVFWGQGQEKMPPLIKACYKQLTSFNANVILVTNQNVHQFISLPSVIIEKVNSGYISWAHYSDIIRNTLLAQHGGLWLDATVWVSGTIPIDKLKNWPIFSANGNVTKTPRSVRFWTSYQWNWSTWCMWAESTNHILYSFVSEMLQAIAKQEQVWPDYVIQDYLIYFACRNFPKVKKEVEKSQEWSCKYRNELANVMNEPYDEVQYRQLIQSDFFFKLSFRTSWKKEINGKLTYYGRILSGIIDFRS